jgi:hypothetical protein
MIAELFDVLVDVSFAEVWSVLVLEHREGTDPHAEAAARLRTTATAPVVVGQR